jgi:hypothetical protein
MACLNPNDPKFQEILARVENPLLAEIEFEKYLTYYNQAKLILAEKIIKSISTGTYTFTYDLEKDTLNLIPQPEAKLTTNKARNAIDAQSSKSNKKNIDNYRLTPVVTKDWEPKKIKIDFNPKYIESQMPKEAFEYSLLPAPELTELEEVSEEATTPTRKQQVLELFKFIPELAAVGTPEQYLEYLDTIFPNSVLKDILYHGTNSDYVQIEGFTREKEGSGYHGSSQLFFAWDKKYSLKYGRKVIRVIVNVQKPDYWGIDNRIASSVISDYVKILDSARQDVDPETWEREQYEKDAVIGIEAQFDEVKSVAVFNYTQAHVLGSRKDIQGFKDFVSKPKFNKELAQTIQDKLQRLYPEIKLNITNNPVWSKGSEVFNQIIENEFGEEYWRDLYTKNSLTNSQDFILVDIPTIENKFAPDFENVYHGTNTYEIDNEGNLILIPSQNFGNKTTSISFTQIPVVAQDYMLRKKGNVIIKIKNEALGSNYDIESAEEIAINDSGLFVVPKGQYKILNVNSLATQAKSKYAAETEEIVQEFKKIGSDFFMLDAIYRTQIDALNYAEYEEYAEFNIFENAPDWYISPEGISRKAADIVYKEIKHKITKDWIIKNFANALIEKIKTTGTPMLSIEGELYQYSEYSPNSPHSTDLFRILIYQLFGGKDIIGKNKETYDEIISSIKIIVDSETKKALDFYNSPEQINLREEQNKKYRLMREQLIKETLEEKNSLGYEELPFQKIGDLIIGQANIKALTVLVDAVNQKQDTLPHEYAHHYIAWFRNTPIVQEAIKKWGSEEALVQSIGEQVVKQKGEAWDWWAKFTNWVMDLFDNLTTKDKQELTNILTDAFLQGVDLETGKTGLTSERVKQLSQQSFGVFNQEINESSLNEVNSKIYSFLKQFGFSLEQLDDLREVSNYSIIGATDFLEKTIFVQSQNVDVAYTHEAAYSILALLGKKNRLRKDLIASIHLIDNYEFLKSKYTNGKLYDYNIRELVAAEYLRDKLIEAHKQVLGVSNKVVSTDATAKSKLAYYVLQIQKWWSEILRKFFKSYKKGYVDNIFNQVANDVINNNTELFNLSPRVEYQKMVLEGPHKKLNDELVEWGAINSGSYSLNKQGNLTRREINDLDYFIPYDKHDGFFKKIIDKYPDAVFSKPFAGIMGKRSVTVLAKINGIKVDFFLPTSQAESDNNRVVIIDGVKYHFWKNIFDAKVRIGSKKHLSDLAGFVPFTRTYNISQLYNWSTFDFMRAFKEGKYKNFSEYQETDRYLNIPGQRHYNFNFIKSKFNKEYYSTGTEIIPTEKIKFTENLLEKALKYFSDNNINIQNSNLYKDLLNHFNQETKPAIISYYLTYSENFRKFYGNIESRSKFPSFHIGNLQGKYSRKSILLDNLGEPIVFYHGAGAIFDEFSKDYFLTGEGAMAFGAGFYATNNKRTADSYRDASNSAMNLFKKLIEEKNEELLKLLAEIKKEITEDTITDLLMGSITIGEENVLGTRLLTMLGLTETKALYISLTNPLNWLENISYSNKVRIENHFKIKLESTLGGEVYKEIQRKLNITDKEVSARLYQIGIDGVTSIKWGGRAVGGFYHKKGEVHVVFFEPVQAKSVTNSGLFSVDNENMYDPIETNQFSTQDERDKENSNIEIQEAKIPESQVNDVINNLPPFTKDFDDIGLEEDACDP